jgi:hypothetical protein
VEATADDGAQFEQAGWLFAGMERAQPAAHLRAAEVTDTEALLQSVGYSAEEIDALRAEGVAA